MKKFLALLLALLMLTGCASAGGETQASASRTEEALAQIAQLGTSPDDNYRTWYEIFVYSFCDSDGDGIGDLQGVISKLDYLQELGINGIWFMPIHPSTSYHKYNVSDYYAIDPDYGTLEDFDTLLAECEKRDIHVILDLVVKRRHICRIWGTGNLIRRSAPILTITSLQRSRRPAIPRWRVRTGTTSPSSARKCPT